MRAFVAVAVVTACGICAGCTPDVQVKSVTPAAVSTGALTLDVELTVTNTTGSSFEIQHVDADITVAKRCQLPRVSSDPWLTVGPHETQTVHLPIVVPWADDGWIFADTMKNRVLAVFVDAWVTTDSVWSPFHKGRDASLSVTAILLKTATSRPQMAIPTIVLDPSPPADLPRCQ